MRNANRYRLLVLQSLSAASLAMLLCCCSRHLPLADLPAPLRVNQPGTCEEILQHVAVPDDQPGDDAIKAYLQNRAAAIVASAEVDLGRACLEKQRADYAGKGGK